MSTPMERQYDSIKEKHLDKILLFRLGDFYEMFNDDAQIASNVLNIAMTKRHDRPMCGFPQHALEQYAYKLVDAGHKVAICDQVEDVSVAKGIVKRDVVSVLTKGTWSENPLLDRSINSFLSIMHYFDKQLCLIFVDVSTGEVEIRSYHGEHSVSFIMDELSRYLPVETICSQSLIDHFSVEEELKTYQKTFRIVPDTYFQDSTEFQNYIQKFNLELSSVEQKCFQGLFVYLTENYFNEHSLKHILAPKRYQDQETLFMNEDTLRHLELTFNNNDFSYKNSLFSVLNQTKTMPASRKLRRLIVSPPAVLSEVLKQQSRTEFFVTLSSNNLSDILKGMSDLERLSARLITGKLLPRECLALADSIQRSETLKDFLASAKPFLEYIVVLKPLDHIVKSILQKINPECSNTIDGEVFLSGVDSTLDELKKILNNSKEFLIKLQAEERLNTGISTLKISYNKVYGYYIEVSKGASKNIPSHYIRKQSLVNSERYTIPALDDFEQKMLQAENSVISLERQLYENFVTELQQCYHDIIALSEFVTEADLRLALASVAKKNRYSKPTITDSFDWNILNGRHPIVEHIHKKDIFVANNTTLNSKERILVVTGPNMAGKSTYLRQNALIAIMAQIGSYIPADESHLGIVDKIFTRIGASDDLSSGRSTFFVEMEEASFIVNHATPKSLIIMDELGRGTSTQDGLALAWAILEHFIFHPQKKAKLFFSTHYHELTDISKFDGVKNLCMSIQENKGKPIFLKKVIAGKAQKSYGIHVAEMAGMDSSIVARAHDILNSLEQGVFFHKSKKQNEQVSLFAVDEHSDKKNKIYQKLSHVDPNLLTPLEALNVLFELKNIENNRES